jgi:hypothetical protein
LLKLERYDEARREIQRAIECFKPFGHAAEPWKTFGILSDLERAVGNVGAAAQAREQALAAYLAYRRDGGEALMGGGLSARLCAAAAEAIADGHPDQAANELVQLSERQDIPAYLKAMIPALQAILSGSRDRGLAADPNLYYADAAELILLMERLEESEKAEGRSEE